MNIPIYRQPEENDTENEEDLEVCIFCSESTVYWNEETNRPVCPLCSVVYTVSDIPSAPYNY